MIEASGLTKYYGGNAAIQDVTFSVPKGAILGFLGPNGAGKTTTMRILAGCLAPTGGSAKIAGFDVFERSMDARQALGYLPEQVPLYPEMRVEEQLRFSGALHGLNSTTLPARMNHALERCGLMDVRRSLVGRLSKGYRQRVGLAQAILHDPQVLILDEPTVGLDPVQIIDVRELIRDLAGDHTVLVSTHILAEVSMICTRVAIINRGRVVAEDSLDNLTGATQNEERLLLEIRGPAEQVTERLRSIDGVVEVGQPELISADVARLAIKCRTDGDSQSVRQLIAESIVKGGFGLLEMHSERQTLEDVFVRLTTSDREAA